MTKSKKYCAALLVLLLLAGCAVPPGSDGADANAYGPETEETTPETVPAAPPDDAKQYSVYMDNDRTLTMNADGTIVDEGGDAHILEDLLTRKPMLKAFTRLEDTGGENEYGEPVARTLSALYDLEGNLLRDWEETSYLSGFGVSSSGRTRGP